MNENIKDGTAKATARRRLIRGAFGAPAALTLYSGNVFAQASSSLRALNNQLAAPKFPLPNLPAAPSVSSPETWIRVQVWKSTADATKLYVQNSDVLALKFGCGYSSVFESGMFTNIADNTQVTSSGLESTTNYAALRFDIGGIIVGVSTGTPVGNQTALTQSAGGSLVVGACL